MVVNYGLKLHRHTAVVSLAVAAVQWVMLAQSHPCIGIEHAALTVYAVAAQAAVSDCVCGRLPLTQYLHSTACIAHCDT